MVMKGFIKDNFKEFLIVSGIVMLGAFFIHLRFNQPPNISSIIVYLPFIWFGVFMLMLTFGLLVFGGKE